MDSLIREVLSTSAISRGLSDDEVASFSQRLEVVELAPQHVLFSLDDIADAAYIIVGGRVQISSGTALIGISLAHTSCR